LQQGIEAGQRALELAKRAGDLIWERIALFFLGEIRYAFGDSEQAIALFQGNIELESLDETLRWSRVGPGMASVVNRRWLAQSLAEVGRFTEGIALGIEAVEIAQTADRPFSLTNGLVALGFVLLRKGDVEQAIPLLERGREVSRTLSFRGQWRSCAIPLAAAYGLSGRPAEAVHALEDAPIESFSVAGSLTGTPAESWLRAGRVDEASRLGPEDLELARAHKARGREAWTLHALGEIAARRDDAEAADTHYRQTLALAESLGMRPLVAHCHLGLGKLARQIGKHERAREHLTTATAMYREMDMRFWLEQAETELKELA